MILLAGELMIVTPADTGAPLDAAGADATDRDAAHDALGRLAYADAVEAEIRDAIRCGYRATPARPSLAMSLSAAFVPEIV